MVRSRTRRSGCVLCSALLCSAQPASALNLGAECYIIVYYIIFPSFVGNPGRRGGGRRIEVAGSNGEECAEREGRREPLVGRRRIGMREEAGSSGSNPIEFAMPSEVREEERGPLREVIRRHHTYEGAEASRCCYSMVAQRINASAEVVWSVVSRFDKPQTYKHFVRSCVMTEGDGRVGSVRQVSVVSGLPATTSTERLDVLDDDRHVMSFRVLGGEHRLRNYRSVTTLSEFLKPDGRAATVVLESYVVDVPDGNTREDTCLFADTVVRCNLQSLAQLAEHLQQDRERRGGAPAPPG